MDISRGSMKRGRQTTVGNQKRRFSGLSDAMSSAS